MMHELIIDQKRCVGTDICHICETVKRGVSAHCTEHGRLLVSWPNTAEHSGTISALIARCPVQAITIKPINEE